MENTALKHPDLFEREKEVLVRARTAHADPSSVVAHIALAELISEYERVIRDMRRVISHSDRTELELNNANQRLRELTEALTFQNRHDGLTRILNRNTFVFETERLLKKTPVALILLDIDHFKHINDRYGHPTGDSVLISFANILEHNVKALGISGRMGGEEFAISLATEDLSAAVTIAEQISSQIRELRCKNKPSLRITASLSVTLANTHVPFEKIYLCGDDALYRAKHNGRDCIEIVQRRLENQ